jgi:hypothetical protein
VTIFRFLPYLNIKLGVRDTRSCRAELSMQCEYHQLSTGQNLITLNLFSMKSSNMGVQVCIMFIITAVKIIKRRKIKTDV